MFKQLKFSMLVLGMALVLPTTGWADITFAQKPLAAGGGVDPNLMFILDDSGSMRWGFMPDGLDAHFNIGGTWSNCSNNGTYGGMYLCYYYTNNGRKFLASSHLNKVYFNPALDYSPPIKANGEQFSDSTFTEARVNGFDASSPQINLSNNYRAVMDDYSYKSGYGRGFAISHDANSEPAFYYTFNSGSGCTSDPYKDSCYTKVVVSESERTNFANWFSYYRTREMAAKSGIGSVFGNPYLSADFRLGWGQINSGYSIVDGADDIKAVKEGVRPYASVKANFLTWLYGISSTGGTPLRSALEGAGRYYENSIRPWVDDPDAEKSDGNPARECRISATMLMTDGYYSGDTLYNLGNFDGEKGEKITNGLGEEGQYIVEAPFSDSVSNSLADIANYFWKRDLQTDIDNYVPTIDPVTDSGSEGIRQTVDNPAFWQHMMTYGIGFGVEGSVSRDEAVNSVLKGTSVDWWKGTSDQNKINDLLHASMNGRGDFFSAGDPDTFRSELEGLLDQFLGRAGSATGLDFNVASIESADSALSFSSVFDPSGWSGDLKATTLVASDNGRPVEADPDDDEGWSARAKLEGTNFDTRTVLTYDGDKGVPFRLDSLTSAQKADLRVGDTTLDQLRVNYLRGKRKATIEAENPGKGKFFRDRSSLLGTIVNSTPRFVGVPDSSWPNSDKFGDGKYTVFRNNNLDRTPVVYVGANDGMLHGFRAKNKVEDGKVTASGGQEVLAYVPSFISSATEDEGLHYLSQPGYDHRYYVDLNLEVVDVHTKGRSLEGVDSTEKWRTVLIGGSRAGAKGIFALDVTNPDGFSEDRAAQSVLWEFTHEKLGYLVEPPEIAQMEWPDGSIRWTVFVPSGYNSGTTGFFMLDLEGGLNGTWTEWGASTGDYIYHEFDSSGTGLSPLTVVDNANDDYVVDRVYAGDLDGTMWVAYNKEGTMTTAYPDGYFKADQPITSAPAVGLGLGGGKDPNIMILFGTGKYLENSDSSNMDDQYFYSVLETSDAVDLPLTVADLVAAPVTNKSGTIDGTTRDIRVENEANVRVDYDTKRGWYTELPTNGERIVNYPIVRGEFVYVNTLIPGANPCLGGGDGYVMGFEILRSKTTTPSYAAFENSTEGAVGFRVGGGPSQLATWGNLLTFGTGSGGAEFIGLPELVLGLGRKGWREMTE